MNDVASATNTVFNDLSIAKKNPAQAQSNELGQSAFLELMITQLENQDPLSPQENSEFIAQLAQFSSVESLDKLNNNFDSFASNFVANQALQASTLVGRSVTVPSDTTDLIPGEVVSASVDVPSSSGEVTLNIYSESGTLVDQVDLGAQPAGELALRWDGIQVEANGNLLDWQSSQENGMPAGTYRFEVLSQQNGEEIQLDTALSANVNSVTVGQNGTLTLNLSGIGPVSLNDIKQFNE